MPSYTPLAFLCQGSAGFGTSNLPANSESLVHARGALKLASTGGGMPYKMHVRSPSFVHMGGVQLMLEGYQLADIIPTFGSVNMIGGECDR